MDNIIDTASFDQFTDFKSVDDIFKIESRVIFSAKAYSKFLNLICQSQRTGGETGCYFLGKEIGNKNSNQIFIDSFTTDFKVEDAFVANGSVVDDDEHRKEIQTQIQQNGYDCVFHYHVHPNNLFFDVFSDQDLSVYEQRATEPFFQFYSNDEIRKISKRNISDSECELYRKTFTESSFMTNGRREFQEKLPAHKKVSYFGMLASPNRTINSTPDNYQFSILYCDPCVENNSISGKFYRFPNIFYIDSKDNSIKKIGSFQRVKAPILTSGRKVSSKPVSIQAIGKNPNTGMYIDDIVVGKYEDGRFIFDKQLSPQNLSQLAREIAGRNPGEISSGVKKTKGFFSKALERLKNIRE